MTNGIATLYIPGRLVSFALVHGEHQVDNF